MKYFQNFVKVVREDQIPKNEFLRDISIQRVRSPKKWKHKPPGKAIQFELHLSSKCLEMMNYFQKSWYFHEIFMGFWFFNSNGDIRRKLKKSALAGCDCSTSSAGWRFTAGSTYRTAVFLKRPAPAKIYDVGREYFDSNDTLHSSY